MVMFQSKENMMNNSFVLRLLLSCLRITCRYFSGDEDICGLSEKYNAKDTEFTEYHTTCNCDGDIDKCDLPNKFQVRL